MPTVVFVTPQGERREIVANEGESVMRTALSNLVPGIIGECGGELSCATCHVYVDEDWADRLPPLSADEESMLDVAAAEPDPTSRLSCQLTCSVDTDGLVVRLPDVQ